MSKDPIFYVYVYLDPRKPGNYVYGEYEFDYEPFYVGKGNNGRAYVHLTEGSLNNNENKLFTNKIKKIQRTCGCNPIIVKHREMLFENMSFELEIDMIKNIGRKDLKKGPLCNLTDGGEGAKNPSADTRNKMILAKKGKHISDEHAKNIGKGNKGKTIKESVKENMKINNPMFNPIYRKKCLDALTYRNKYNNPMKNPESIRKMVENKCNVFYNVINTLTNECFIISNMANFCREHNLNRQSMSHIINGRQKEHRGFMCSINRKR